MKKMIKLTMLGLSLYVSLGALGDSNQTSILKEPAFAPLEEGEESFDARIVDEGTVTEIAQVSFFGHTSVGGVRREDNDSMTKIDLALTKTIKVKKQTFDSMRYPGQDFALIEKTALDGSVIDGLLVPRHIIICGIEKTSGDKKAWFINKIDEIHIVGNQKDIAKEPSVQDIKNIVQGDAVAKEPLNERAHHQLKTQASEHQSLQRVDEAKKKNIQTAEQYKELEVKIIDKAGIEASKTIPESLKDLLVAIFNVVHAVINFIKNLIW